MFRHCLDGLPWYLDIWVPECGTQWLWWCCDFSRSIQQVSNSVKYSNIYWIDWIKMLYNHFTSTWSISLTLLIPPWPYLWPNNKFDISGFDCMDNCYWLPWDLAHIHPRFLKPTSELIKDSDSSFFGDAILLKANCSFGASWLFCCLYLYKHWCDTNKGPDWLNAKHSLLKRDIDNLQKNLKVFFGTEDKVKTFTIRGFK